MWSLGRLFVLSVLVWFLAATPIFAIEQAASGKIIITGEVPPLKSIAVNEDGLITRVVSNSDTDGRLLFFRDKDFKDVIPLTAELLQQYEKLNQQYNFNKIGQVFPVITEITSPSVEISDQAITLKVIDTEATGVTVFKNQSANISSANSLPSSNTPLIQSAADLLKDSSLRLSLQGN